MTYNEEVNLPACMESVGAHVDQIILVDSFSTDNTIEIAKKYGAEIFQNKWINYSRQYLWAVANTPIRNEWLLRLDADERWTTVGFSELRDIIENDKADGVFVKMKIYFMGRWIKRGGFYPNNFLRVYKDAEIIMLTGHGTIESGIDVDEQNYDRQKNIGLCTAKHNGYSTREAVEFLSQKHRLIPIDTIGRLFGNKTERKRWLKENFYFRVPLFVRPFLYFFYRYIFKLGFLDGKEGFIFQTLHAFWYRFLVDGKVLQIERNAKAEGSSIKEAIRVHYGIEL